MARKGNHQKTGSERHASNSKKKGSDLQSKVQGRVQEIKVRSGEELPNENHYSRSIEEGMVNSDTGEGIKNVKNSAKSLRKEKQGTEELHTPDEPTFPSKEFENCNGDNEGSRIGERYKGSTGDRERVHLDCSYRERIRNVVDNIKFSDNILVKSFVEFLSSTFEAAHVFLEKQRPLFNSMKKSLLNTSDCVGKKIKKAYPIVLKWMMHFGNIMLLISIVWLDCAFRGIDSFIRMGTTSFFSVIWFSILSTIAMVGLLKFLVVLVIAASLGIFVGSAFAIFVVAISGIAFLWFYGNFWTTLLIISLGGLAFILSHERVALFITTLYSVYCGWVGTGWLGLLLGLNLSFISSDALIYVLKNNMNEHRRSNRYPEQAAGMQDQPGFFQDDPMQASSSEFSAGFAADRSSGTPSTSGADSELSSEDEVIRLLNCTDYYAVLGLSRFEDIVPSLLKKEYRKKAMLVHPDKNMGNEKAAEAFKKLQNAYEVLLDSLKRKNYDDGLRREELLNVFRRFQSASQKSGGIGPFASSRSATDREDLSGESRRIACKKCNNFHLWIHTRKLKSQARWCQECKDFHQAKDGDGWVEQSSQPFLFGLLQKVDAPSAYVCAESRIYDATEWYICQGMRCPANTHRPSFHVNTTTSVASKQNTSRGSSSSQRGGQMPPSNIEENMMNMTEEELFEWFQNAVLTGVFDNGGGSATESPSAKAGGSFNKSSSNSGSGNKKKKKGKKQW
ncbi:uncharacterized protein LOC111494407 isoform X1 [Cucurbita maxima]|uniref:Uncharacterized protein LOC111494407 isoform X1 n=1 Tax=Cucurbita maxima TaxID=3661 RepID=A0A6J1KCN8_CUCMA|nr:uncharacterized protein LOC111494407 isoform X1 [Cucurbita maxima]